MGGMQTLLTGGTGVLGLELLPALLRAEPDGGVTLLVRAATAGRLRARQASIEAYLRFHHPGLGLSRLTVVAGDVALPGLGLAPAVRDELQARITRVIHGAASTRLDADLTTARRVNVRGTEHVLRFAAGCAALERFAHVGTAYVAGTRTGIIAEDRPDRGQRFLNAYQRAKLEAELRVRERSDDLPITIFRPSIIVGDSCDGHIASLGGIYMPLRRIALGEVRAIPGPGDTPLDLVPVDHVAGAIARLLGSPRSIGATYHLTAGRGNTVTARELVTAAIRHAGRDRGRPARFEDDPPGSATTPDPAAPGPAGQAERLRVFFDHLGRSWDFDDARAVRDLGAFARRRARPADFLPRLFAFCRRTRWGERLPWISKARLDAQDTGRAIASSVAAASPGRTEGGGEPCRSAWNGVS